MPTDSLPTRHSRTVQSTVGDTPEALQESLFECYHDLVLIMAASSRAMLYDDRAKLVAAVKHVRSALDALGHIDPIHPNDLVIHVRAPSLPEARTAVLRICLPWRKGGR